MSKKFAPYTDLEKEILFSLVEDRINIIENKQNCGTKIEQKNKCWLEIESEFNSNVNVSNRNAKQLKTLWRNLKARAKKVVSSEKQEKRKTGGGPQPKPDSNDDLSRKLISLLPQQMDGLYNQFDSDSIQVSVMFLTSN